MECRLAHAGQRERSRREQEPPEAVRADLERELYRSLRAANRVYRLRDLGDDALHDWGWVLWEPITGASR